MTYTKLLATIFSGQITTFTNTGTAGGSFSYIDLGGIKVLWGLTAGVSTGSSKTVTFPTSFYSAAPVVVVSAQPASSFTQYANTVSVSTTTATLSTQGNAGSPPIHVIAIGY